MKTERYAFILISDQKYWKKLSQRGKTDIRVHAFVRKNHVAPSAAEKLLFYVKKPVMQILGIADFGTFDRFNSGALGYVRRRDLFRLV